MTRSAQLFPYLHHQPVCAEAPVADASVAIIGRTTLGRGARFGSLATLRADGHHITVGDDFWMGARSTIHIAHEVLPAVVGHGVTVGYNTTVHACTVGNDCVIEDNVVILDGAVVGDHCVVAAGSVVFPRAQLPAGHFCEGSPAKPVRELTPEQLKAARERLRGLSLAARVVPPAGLPPRLGSSNFIAPTAVLEGRISLAPDASVWYACELRAGEHEIAVGEGTNVQDNTVILANHGPVRIEHRAVDLALVAVCLGKRQARRQESKPQQGGDTIHDDLPMREARIIIRIIVSHEDPMNGATP